MSLTQRQENVARLVSKGASRTTISEQLGVSVSSVDKTIRILKTKLNASNQMELVVRCARHFQNADNRMSGPMAGRLDRHSPDQSDAIGSIGPAFSGVETFDDLFAAFMTQLSPFGITHITYSHIRHDAETGKIDHLGSRWSFPEEVTFDMSIPAEDNFALKHAVNSWLPAPLDLEELIQSELYSYLPENIRRQNEIFCAAGLCRGVTLVLPGRVHAERLVLSVLLQHATRLRFEAFLNENLVNVQVIAMQFRNVHISLGKSGAALSRDEKAAIDKLADGQSVMEIADEMKVSRRAVDRLLSQVRTAYQARTNSAAVAAHVRCKLVPELPF